MDNTSAEILESGLALLHIPLSKRYCESLQRYCDLIEAGNKYHSFVAASGVELIIKHILDSLAPHDIFSKLINENGYHEIADFGSGAGLPGIPLALTFPDIHVTLIDRMTKRIQFLESVIYKLDLRNVSVIETQAEHCKEHFDIITFRAFHPFEYKLFKKIFKLCNSNGVIAGYKGKKEKIEAEIHAILGLIDSFSIVPLSVPFLAEERCLAIIKPKTV